MATAGDPRSGGTGPSGTHAPSSSGGGDLTGRHTGTDDHDRTDETKHATKTSEFAVYVVLALGLVIASAVAEGFGANRFFLFLTILTVGYLLSRGLAKALRGRGRGNETKPSFKTTEFWIFVAALVALFITGLGTAEGDFGETDTLGADRIWLYAAILGAAYLVSRGLAKSGAGARASADHGHGGASITDRAKAAADAFSGSQSAPGQGGRSGGV